MTITAKPLTQTLTPGYTRRRPIGHLTATCKATLVPEEFVWMIREWQNFTGGEEDSDFNVIMERITPITHTRVWICDRDGPDSRPLLMLPEDY